jgi:hypothetical protein
MADYAELSGPYRSGNYQDPRQQSRQPAQQGQYMTPVPVQENTGQYSELAPAPPARTSTVRSFSSVPSESEFGFGDDVRLDTLGKGTMRSESIYREHDYVYQEIPATQVKVNVNPDLTREQADSILKKGGMKVGDYVLRTSLSHPGSYVICLVTPTGILHYPVERLAQPPFDGHFLVISPEERRRFECLAEVVRYFSVQSGGLGAVLSHRLG